MSTKMNASRDESGMKLREEWDGASAQGQVADLTLPFAGLAALGDYEKVFNRLGERDAPGNLEYAGHWLAGTHAVVGMFSDGRDIVADQDTALLGGPFEDCRIVGSGQARILHAQQIKPGASAEQSPHNVVVEILVDRQRDHSAGAVAGRAAGHKAVAHALRIESPLVLAPHRVANFRAARQVSRDFLLMAEDVSQHGIDIGQRKCRILLRDFFSGGAIPKRLHDRVEGDARAADADDAVRVRRERNGLGLFNGQAHADMVMEPPSSASEILCPLPAASERSRAVGEKRRACAKTPSRLLSRYLLISVPQY